MNYLFGMEQIVMMIIILKVLKKLLSIHCCNCQNFGFPCVTE